MLWSWWSRLQKDTRWDILISWRAYDRALASINLSNISIARRDSLFQSHIIALSKPRSCPIMAQSDYSFCFRCTGSTNQWINESTLRNAWSLHAKRDWLWVFGQVNMSISKARFLSLSKNVIRILEMTWIMLFSFSWWIYSMVFLFIFFSWPSCQ